MTSIIIYVGIFHGMYVATGKLWRSLIWPYHVGHLLAANLRTDAAVKDPHHD